MKFKLFTAAQIWALEPTVKNRERLKSLMSCAAAELGADGKERDELDFGNLVYHHEEIRKILELAAKGCKSSAV